MNFLNNPFVKEIVRLSKESNKEDSHKKCKYCGVTFIPSATASVTDVCHACIMATM